MSIDLLDTPLRITWDLHGSPDGTPAREILTVAQELVVAGVFFVTLDRRPLLHREIAGALEVLSRGGVQTLLLAGTPGELEALTPGLPLHTLFIDVQPLLPPSPGDFSLLEEVVSKVRSAGYEPALWLVPRSDNFHMLPELLSFARRAGTTRIKLPNTPANGTVCPFRHLPRPDDLDRLRHLLGTDPAGWHEGLALEVHDLFLWEILFPGRQDGRSEYGGCQAGNSIAHVDAGGNLHPCSSWPETLGSLLTTPLVDIWESAERRRVREEIAASPAGCAGCRDYALCLGGCRGLGRFVNFSEGGRDPLCREPRG